MGRSTAGIRPSGGGAVGDLVVTAIHPIPERLAVGRGTAIFVDGRCSHADGPLEDLRVSADGADHPVLASGMSPPGAREGSDYWWAIVAFGAVSRPRLAELRLRARTARGREVVADLGTVELLPFPEVRDAGPSLRSLTATSPDGRGVGQPLIAICMATFEPPLDLFRRQIESIRAQSYGNWVCVISDDRSSSDRLAEMRAVLADDERFSLVPGPVRLGPYGNFERALALAPREAVLVAMCDQDDRWYPEKLKTLESRMESGTKLVYSDMRIVDRGGTVLSDTYWRYRPNNHTNFGSLVLANTITGAASLFTREVLDSALPFPPHHAGRYHDHWVALVAMALGPIAYVDWPLYDYVQHEGAVLGHARANGLLMGVPRGAEAASDEPPVRGWLARVTTHGLARETRRLYFANYCGTTIAAKAAEMRCGGVMTPAKRRTLRRLGHPWRMIAWLALRSLRAWMGKKETLRREEALIGGLTWRYVAEVRKRLRRIPERLRHDEAAGGGRTRRRALPPW